MTELLNEIFLFYRETTPYMMFGLMFVGILHASVSKDFITKHIGSSSFMSSVKASILGIPLPLCSCGVIPTAAYLSSKGASKGAVISFLISTPQTGIDSVIATYGLLGPIFAVFRPIAAFFSGIFGGIITEIFGKNMNFKVSKYESHSHCDCDNESCNMHKKESKLNSFYSFAFSEFLDDISFHLIAGIAIAAIISVYVPEDFFLQYSVGSGLKGMLLMIVIGLPMYICATTSIPVALALIGKGISPGAAFVFLAVGPMTNIASITVLYKILKGKMMTVYLFSGIVFAILSGSILDLIFMKFGYTIPSGIIANSEKSGVLSVISDTAAIIFSIFLLFSILRKLKTIIKRKINEKKYKNLQNKRNEL